MTPAGATAAGRVAELLDRARSELAGTGSEADLDRISARLNGPLRVAIAGRVKSGKSTLLNALVGERLAPTDAGECTKIVSWYRRGSGYEVNAVLPDGERRSVAFRRNEGALSIDLGGLTEREVQSLDIEWPTTALEKLTLIDTPGLASINDENSRRTREFLEVESARAGDADAVIYLMRHVHRSDVEFLDAFMDRSVTASSPINAVAVLSRADEIGAGRVDAMASAKRIADRYSTNSEVRSLCATVTPLAGLLAETGLTLREDEATALRTLASTDPEVLDGMLLSADRFCEMHDSDLTVEIRRSLLARLGMFGVRISLEEIRAGATSAAILGPKLVAASGLDDLKAVISDHFLPRARSLQARTALVAVRALTRDLRQAGHESQAGWIDRAAEEIEASGVEFARLRAIHLIAVGAAEFDDGDRADLDRLFQAADPAEVLAPGAADPSAAALDAIARWRGRAEDPLAPPALREVCETAVRVCEGVFASAHTGT